MRQVEELNEVAELKEKIAELEARLEKLEEQKKEPSEVEKLLELGRQLAQSRSKGKEGFIPPAWEEAERDPARPIR